MKQRGENKSRQHKVKILHHSIDDLYPLLDKIADFEEVQSVVPLSYSPKAKAGQGLRFRISRNEDMGVRITCTNKGFAQAVLITCNASKREELAEKLRTLCEYDDGSKHGKRPRQKKR